ncbi:MAG: hypothetical protein LBC77_05795, partial [Spirochaetaceae bacterium]|nr:hypothetical protein [Spirochaetaceae bacterium]
MAIDFIPKDVMHRVAVKFTKAFLPGAKKPYNLKTVHQPELDVHEIASKAAVYNITTAPKVIEEGLTAGMELMAYLVADGYKIKTPLFGMSIRVQGEYDGSESVLPKGVSPQVKVRAAAELQKYVAEHVTVEFDGMDEAEG